MNISKVEEKVEKILERDSQSRCDDFILILQVYKEITNEMNFENLMRNHKELNLPSQASITRARRKIFEYRPELRPEHTSEIRKELEEEFKEYSRK